MAWRGWRVGRRSQGRGAIAASLAYTSSMMTRRPTIAAALWRLDRVMSSLASRSRSTWVRLVLSRMAMRFLEIFFFFMASASCEAFLDGLGLRLFDNPLVLEEGVDARSHVFPAHCSSSFLRIRANARSLSGIGEGIWPSSAIVAE
jgi:hypothetical protein